MKDQDYSATTQRIYHGMYMYGSIVQQFIVDYRGANGMHAEQQVLRQVLIDFLLSIAITTALSGLNMLLVSRIF